MLFNLCVKHYINAICTIENKIFLQCLNSEVFPTIGKLVYNHPAGVTNHPPRYEINQYYSVCTAIWRESSAAHCL